MKWYNVIIYLLRQKVRKEETMIEAININDLYKDELYGYNKKVVLFFFPYASFSDKNTNEEAFYKNTFSNAYKSQLSNVSDSTGSEIYFAFPGYSEYGHMLDSNNWTRVKIQGEETDVYFNYESYMEIKKCISDCYKRKTGVSNKDLDCKVVEYKLIENNTGSSIKYEIDLNSLKIRKIHPKVDLPAVFSDEFYDRDKNQFKTIDERHAKIMEVVGIVISYIFSRK